MKIQVQAIGMTPHAPLEEHLEKKISKLDTFYDRIIECQLTLKLENTTEKDNKHAELRVVIPGDDILVKKTTSTFEESIDLCVDTAKKLLIKHKETK